MAVQIVRHPKSAAKPLQQAIMVDIGLLATREKHPHARQDEESCEQIQHPVITPDQRRAAADHDGPQRDHAQHAPEQHPVLIAARDREGAEDQGDDEDVVHRQAFLDGIGGQVFEGAVRTQPAPDPAAEGQGHRDIEERQPQTFPNADLMIVAVQYAEIQRQQRQNGEEEAAPHPGRLAHPLQEQPLHPNLRESIPMARPTSRLHGRQRGPVRRSPTSQGVSRSTAA
ncbi:hypothetical protein D3C77_379800 [compost metagenome]